MKLLEDYLPGLMYTVGIIIIGATLNLRWFTGFGIWLAGVGLSAGIIWKVRL